MLALQGSSGSWRGTTGVRQAATSRRTLIQFFLGGLAISRRLFKQILDVVVSRSGNTRSMGFIGGFLPIPGLDRCRKAGKLVLDAACAKVVDHVVKRFS